MNTKGIFKALFEPRSLAFVGASQNVFKWGFNILHHIFKGGYEGRVFPVNARGEEWFGRKSYRDLEEIPEPVDCAVIVVPAEQVLEEVRKCARKGVPVAIVITAGFSETGMEGALAERRIIEAAREGGVRVVGPNTMGIYSASPSPLHAMMASGTVPAGRVAIVSQSGNLGTSLTYRFKRRGIGLSRMISSGNEADLSMEDYLELLECDPLTGLVCLYVEGVRDGVRFMECAKRMATKKPLLLLKGGRTESGSKAALSHTGAIAGDRAVFDAVCRQAGIIQVETMNEMIDAAGLIVSQPSPAGNRAGIVTLGGGWGVIATDMCERCGLELPPLSGASVETLDRILPPFWSRRNPIDLVAPNSVTVITESVRVLAEEPHIDAVLVLGLGYMTLRARRWLESTVVPKAHIEKPASLMMGEEMKLLNLLIDMIKTYRKPIIPVIDIMAFDEQMENNPVRHLESKGVMPYTSPEEAILALSRELERLRAVARITVNSA